MSLFDTQMHKMNYQKCKHKNDVHQQQTKFVHVNEKKKSYMRCSNSAV